MKWFPFKISCCGLLLAQMSFSVRAEVRPPSLHLLESITQPQSSPSLPLTTILPSEQLDSITAVAEINRVESTPSDSVRTRYHRRVHHYTRTWDRLIPRYQKIQFAGSMGFLSFGVGWQYCKDRLETDVLFGFIPAFEDTRAKGTFTIKQNYIPFEIFLGDTPWAVEPLTCGLYINSILDNRFWQKEPQRYPENYYKFSTKIRSHIFLGQRITYHLKSQKSIHKSLTAFYELSSCDLYIISAAINRTLRPRDYLSLSFGVKMQIF